MTTTQVLEEIKTTRDKQLNKFFVAKFAPIKIIYTVVYVICALLLSYVFVNSSLVISSVEGESLIEKIVYAVVYVSVPSLLFYFLLRFGRYRRKYVFGFFKASRLDMVYGEDYTVGRCVWRYIVTAVMAPVFFIVFFSPDIIGDIGNNTIKLSGMIIYWFMVALAVAVHLLCAILWNKTWSSDVKSEVITLCSEKLKSLNGDDLSYGEMYRVLEDIDTYIANSRQYHDKSISELNPEKIAEDEAKWRAEHPELNRLGELLGEYFEIEREKQYREAEEERLRREVSDLKYEAGKLNDQLKDIKDELDRYK